MSDEQILALFREGLDVCIERAHGHVTVGVITETPDGPVELALDLVDERFAD